MDKLKFIGFVIGFMVVYYLLLSVLMPLLVTTAGDAVTEVEASPHASEYVSAVAGLNYAPLFLYIIPAVLAMVVIVFKLRRKA